MRGRLHHEVYARIATATKASMALLGGSSSVGNMFGMCRQNVERWYRMDVDTENRFIPLAKLVELEHEVASSGGIPQVIKALADECGFDLVRREGSKSDTCFPSLLAKFAKSSGESLGNLTEAYADQELDLNECEVGIDDLERHIEGVQQIVSLMKQKQKTLTKRNSKEP